MGWFLLLLNPTAAYCLLLPIEYVSYWKSEFPFEGLQLRKEVHAKHCEVVFLLGQEAPWSLKYLLFVK